MRKTIFLTSAFLLSAAVVPAAPAQLLGGGSLGGGLGGGLGGSLGGALGGSGSMTGSLDTIGRSTNTVTSTANGTLRGSARAQGSKSVDRKTGKASAGGSAGAAGEGALSQTLRVPGRSVDAAGSGGASAEKSGSVDAQLIGTDHVRSIAGTARSAAEGTVNAATGRARSAAGGARGEAEGTGSGALGATGNAAGQGQNMGLALAGSAMASAQGTLDVARGMTLYSPDGEKLGKVKRVVADSNGEVEQLLVKVDGQEALLPADSFSASGDMLVTGMSEAEIRQAGEAQDNASDEPAQTAGSEG